MTGDDAALTGAGRLRRLFAVPGYRQLCASSALWYTTRWGGLFMTTYLLTRLAGSPLLNQIAANKTRMDTKTGTLKGKYHGAMAAEPKIAKLGYPAPAISFFQSVLDAAGAT